MVLEHFRRGNESIEQAAVARFRGDRGLAIMHPMPRHESCVSAGRSAEAEQNSARELAEVSVHNVLPNALTINGSRRTCRYTTLRTASNAAPPSRSEEHTSELQSRLHLVCRLLLEKKKRAPWTTSTK